MRILRNAQALLNYQAQAPTSCTGFVPTMGALHAGHSALVQQAQQECDRVMVSIFVNPLQFNQSADLEAYPQTIEADIALLENLRCDALFMPNVTDLYPQPVRTSFQLDQRFSILEGKHRPNHFNGVAIVLCKLFHLIAPQKVYFGEKDWQQCLLVEQLISDLGFMTTLRTVPTVRNAQGVALASRNLRLSPAQQAHSPAIYEQLCHVRTQLTTPPFAATPMQLKTHAQAALTAQEFRVEYFEIVDSYTLHALDQVQRPQKNLSLCVAAHLGEVRLIDHMKFDIP